MMKHCKECFDLLPMNEKYFSKQRKYLSGMCKTCKSEYDRNHKNANKDYYREYNKNYREKNREKINEYTRRYHKENKDKAREYRQKNKERIKKYRRKYLQENLEIYRTYNQERRARKRTLISTFTASQWNECLEYFNQSCAYCGDTNRLEQEHVIPVTKGGHYTLDNIIPACKSCNSSKHNKLLEEWYFAHEKYSEKRLDKIKNYLNEITSKE